MFVLGYSLFQMGPSDALDIAIALLLEKACTKAKE